MAGYTSASFAASQSGAAWSFDTNGNFFVSGSIAIDNLGATTGIRFFNGGLTFGSSGVIQITSGNENGTVDTILTRGAAAAWQLGNTNAASPVNQTLQVQGSRSGTDSNVGGGTLTIQPGAGTGTGTGSTVTFNTPAQAAGGTGAQTQTLVMQLTATQQVKLGAASFTANGSTLWAAGSNCPGNATVQEWLTIVDSGGTTRYIPCF